VEKDLDILIKPRMIYCVQDQTFLPPEPDGIVLPPLDIPRNWFAGDRQGAVKLPKGFPREIKKITLQPYGPYTSPLNIPVSGTNKAIRLERNLLRFVPNRFGVLGLSMPWSATVWRGTPGNFGPAGTNVPGGIEVVYEAGLTKNQIENDYYPILDMVMLAAQIGVLTQVQARIGNGAQREKLGQDGLINEIDYPKREGFGPLGGELKQMEKQYQALLHSMRAGQLSFIYVQ
jgi:hypothetical protein